MKYDHILVRYGELTLKTKNRMMFVGKLKSRMERALNSTEAVVRANRDRAYIDLNGEDETQVINKIKHISGILSMSPVVKIEKSIDEMKEYAVKFANGFKKASTFKIEVKRADKNFPLKTHDIQQLLGTEVLTYEDHLIVDVRKPDYKLMVEVRFDAIYMYSDVVLGIGGLPLGTGGKALLMLSGGIDSPVAGFEIMKRGVEIEAIHFHSPPYTSEMSLDKVKKLIDIMSLKTGEHIKLHVIPFTDLQTTVHDHVPDNLSMTTTRRIMLTLAKRLATEIGAEAIVNGENLGQVASQTLTSMFAINEVTSMPVLRPLLTLEKNEIIKKAVEFETYETSILPYEDCCTIFKPKAPKTRPNLEKVKQFESKMDITEKLEIALKNHTIYTDEERNNEEFTGLL
ncbi:MAG TPA: tRNA uracil 4-sulfurtransferase ThiI [Jeotgalicoccus sp.]|nr:tRNA uracil 4-sulfurtransferase ThiI [Jeotgalicoccus sp.]